MLCDKSESFGMSREYRDNFICRDTQGRLKGEIFRAVCLCKTCSYVFWKVQKLMNSSVEYIANWKLFLQDYGHPCSGTTNAAVDVDTAAAVNAHQDQTQGLTAEQFLHLFIR